MRLLHDEHHGTKACNDTDSGQTLRNGVCRIYQCLSVGRSANWAIIASLTSSYGSSIPGCNGSVYPFRTTPTGNRPSITRPSTKFLPNGPMMGRSGRRLWPVCTIWRQKNILTPAYSMATGPTPWPKKGGWHWVLGAQTPEGRQGHCHHR